jgi:hypothetical protein
MHAYIGNIEFYLFFLLVDGVFSTVDYVLRRIFGPKRDDVTGDWRKLYNEELHNLYSSPNISR